MWAANPTPRAGASVWETGSVTGAPQPGPDERATPRTRQAQTLLGTVGVVNRRVSGAETMAANRRWWDADAEDSPRRKQPLSMGPEGVPRPASCSVCG